MTMSEYLRDLAERLMRVPVMYGTDSADVDQLSYIAKQMDLVGGIAEGSTTANSLPHIAKIVSQDIEADDEK